MAATQTDVSLKLVANKETNKVLFAEAEKDFVDILFSFLTLPLGTIARLVEKESSIGPLKVGCLNSLYHSVEGLQMRPEISKEMFLKPRNSSEDYCNTLKLNVDDTESTKYFLCKLINSPCNRLSTISTDTKCLCGNPLTRAVTLKHFCNGFVNADVTFVITDDLVVMPNTVDYITSFALLQNLGIKTMSSVKKMTLNITKEKVLDLLKCCMFSKSSLTNLLLEKKPILKMSRFFSCSVESVVNIKIMLKLLTRKSDDKILFAQGGKDFADMLLSFLTFPLGGVLCKLGGNCFVGNIENLYKSVAGLDENLYLNSTEAKCRLFDPHLPPWLKLSHQILPMLQPGVLRYYCYHNHQNSCDYLQFTHAHAGLNIYGNFKRMYPINPESQTESAEGFVRGPGMYIVTDDLVLARFSPISAVNLLNRLNTPLDGLKEKVVTIGFKECVNILKASLTSTSALTNGLGHLLKEVEEEK